MIYRVKEYREKAGMTQEELAAKSGVSRGTIIRLEDNTQKTATTKTLSKIADALGVTVGDIFLI